MNGKPDRVVPKNPFERNNNRLQIDPQLNPSYRWTVISREVVIVWQSLLPWLLHKIREVRLLIPC